MINSRRSKLAALFGLAIVFASALLFLRIFPEQEAIHLTCLLFIILGEVLPIACFIWIEDAQAFTRGPTMSRGLRAGMHTLFFVYGLSAVSLALTCLALDATPRFLATLQIVLALAFGAILLFAAILGGKRYERRENTLAAVTFMRHLDDEIYRYAQEPMNQAYVPLLHQIEEAIRFSDFSGQTRVDAALVEKVRELGFVLRKSRGDEMHRELETEKQVKLLTEDLLNLLQRRNRELLNAKKERSLSNG